MPNRNYVNGRAKEYYIKKKEEKNGCLAFRSAGSHSPVDVVSINTTTKTIRLIQCKPKSMSENKKNKIKEENIGLNGSFQVSFEVL